MLRGIRRLRVAAFLSHPIQYFPPLWRELSGRPELELCVFYFARHGLEPAFDREFARSFAWDIELLGGYQSRFLARLWPTRDPLDPSARALNRGLWSSLREGWDAVFIHGYAHWNNWSIVLACGALGIPVLCLADSNLRGEAGKPAHKRAAKRAVLGRLLPRMAALLAPSGATRAYFEHYGARPGSVFHCPFAIDIRRFDARLAATSDAERSAWRRRWGVPDASRIAMFCGKLVAWKRPADLLRAVQRSPLTDVKAVFVGDGVLRAELEAQSGGRAAFAGFVNQRDIPLALSLSDVLVLSSSYEPYGIAVAEAQALGIPAIVSHACGCHGPEAVLQDGVSGLVYPTGDIGALSERLTRVLADPALRARMAAAARQQGLRQSPAAAADGFMAALHYAVHGPRAG